jgi:hypothetical protein
MFSDLSSRLRKQKVTGKTDRLPTGRQTGKLLLALASGTILSSTELVVLSQYRSYFTTGGLSSVSSSWRQALPSFKTRIFFKLIFLIFNILFLLIFYIIVVAIVFALYSLCVVCPLLFV